jgi:hypothetical protein
MVVWKMDVEFCFLNLVSRFPPFGPLNGFSSGSSQPSSQQNIAHNYHNKHAHAYCRLRFCLDHHVVMARRQMSHPSGT